HCSLYHTIAHRVFRSLLHCSVSIRCSIRSGTIRASKESPTRPHRAENNYSSAAIADRSGQKATTARATMIPTETSMNRCRATIHAGFVRGIKTMIVRVTLAYRSVVIRGSRLSLERGRTEPLFRSSLKSIRSTAGIASALNDNGRVQAPSGNHSNGTGGSDLDRGLAFTAMEREPTVGTCAICGRPLTQVGPKGECLRCLADLGFLSGSQEPGRSETPRRLTPGPLKYDHFEVEVGADGFPA